VTISVNHAGLRALAATLLVVAAACLSAPAWSEVALTPHEARYKVKITVVSGKLNTRLALTENGYEATHVIAPTGMSRLLARGDIAETSEFVSGPDGIVPIAYRTNDTLSRDKTRAEVRFDWEANKAVGIVDGEAVLTELEGLSHDRVSIQYQLMHDLLNESPNEQYRMYEVDKLRTVNIRNIGTRQVKVRAGKFEAIGIQHQAENSSRVTTLWCVAELDYLPVIIEQHRKGKLRVRATLESYSPVASDTAATE
jgi:hypothetical protein